MLLPQREGLLASKVEVLGVVVHKLGLRHTGRGGTGLGDSVKGDKAFPRNVVNLLGGLGVVQHLHKGGGQVLDMAQLCHLQRYQYDSDGWPCLTEAHINH